MTYVKSTLSDCLQSLADRHNSGTLPNKATTTTLWTRTLNRGLDYCARRLNLIKSTPLSTVNGTIALPDDFKTIFRVFKDTSELTQLGQDDLDKQTGLSFWITGDNFNGYAINTPSDMDLTVEYYFYPAKMVTGTDICIIPDIEAVVSYAYAMLRKSESDPFEDADRAFAECDSRLTELKSDQTANNNNLDFQLIKGA